MDTGLPPTATSGFRVFLLAAVLVGGFVLAPTAVAGTIRDIWHTSTG
jgi:hypothetical protein